MSEERTGSLVKALAEGVRDDLADVAGDLVALRSRVDALGESARAINGLGAACAGWADHLNTLIAEVQKEQREVPAKLLGTPIREITTTVNLEHADAVAAKRKAS